MMKSSIIDSKYENDPRDTLINSQPIGAEATSILISESRVVVEGSWEDNVYDCLNDNPTCLMGWCFPWIQIAQTYEKVIGPRKICKNITCTFLTFNLLFFITSGLYNSSDSLYYLYAYRTVALLSNLYVLILLTSIRKGIRKYYSIPETTCKGCEDVCCSFWCPVCVSCQNARQIYERTPSGDKGGCGCTTTGDPSPNEQIWLHEHQPVRCSSYEDFDSI